MPLEQPALKQTIDEPGVEDVSSPGCIDHRDTIGGDMVKPLAIRRQNTSLPQGCGSETTAVTTLHSLQRSFGDFVVHKTAREIAADDEVVDVYQKLFDAWINLVQIGDYGNASGTSPTGCQGCCCSVVAIDVKGSRIHDPFAVEIAGLKNKPLVAPAKHRALTAVIDQDKGLWAVAAWDSDELCFHTGAGKGFAMKGRGNVVAQLSYIPSAQSPVLTGDDSGRDLSSRQQGRSLVFNL